MNQIKLLITIFVFSLLNACGGGGSDSGGNTHPAVPLPTDSVSGTVMFNGSPMNSVTVIAIDGNTNSTLGVTTTDVNGNYSFSGISTSGNATHNVQFFASKLGYAFSPIMASNPSGSMADYQFDPAPNNWYVNTGAAVTRAGYNSQFSNLNGGGSGIAFTVINYMAIANNSITGADFNAYDGTNPLVSLAATGQTTSYVVGDGASLNKGVALPSVRFVDNKNGTVADNLTGLIWLQNAGCFAPTLWATAINDANQLSNGNCGLADGSKAGDWRLPNLGELESIIDVSANNPAITVANPFTHVSNGIYWTSTSYYGGESGSPNAWAIRMSDGRYINDTTTINPISGYSNFNLKATSNNAVWAVKGNSVGTGKLQATGAYIPYASGDDGSVQNGARLTFPRMRDNLNGTVTDTVTGLIWLKKADCINQSWAGAIVAVNGLANGQCGLTDGSTAGQWRMPNRNEMQSLSDRALNNHADYFNSSFISINKDINSQPAIFTNFQVFQYYWTSTTNAANPSEAWTVFSCDFGVYDIPKANIGYALAVR